VVTFFTAALFMGTAVLALWVDTRLPQLAPRGIKMRALFTIVMLQVCAFVPIANDSYVGLYASVFGVLAPLLIAMWLSTLWLLRAAADALASRF
jgi:hypothetical protein